MSAARVVRAQRVVAWALTLSLLTGGVRSAHAAGDDTAESKVGVVMAALCGFALRWAIPAPVPWAGVAAAACTFAFLDAAMSPDNTPASDPPPKP
jgi:predicted metal-binding membrane protein